jgi:hypothetical protein
LRLLPQARRGLADRSGGKPDPAARGGDAAVHYREGSDQAEFIVCTQCGVLVMATYWSEDRLFAALNVRAIDGPSDFAPEQVAQPRLLSAQDKPLRWQQLWFADVRIEID